MPRREDEEITRIHVQVYDSDLEILNSIYSDNIGVSKAIRKIIRSWIEQNNVKLSQITGGLKSII